jgi:hypothetical protein
MAKPAYSVRANINLIEGVLKAVHEFIANSKQAGFHGITHYSVTIGADASKGTDSDFDLGAEETSLHCRLSPQTTFRQGSLGPGPPLERPTATSWLTAGCRLI